MNSGVYGEWRTSENRFPAKLVVAGGKLPFGHPTYEDDEVQALHFRFSQTVHQTSQKLHFSPCVKSL